MRDFSDPQYVEWRRQVRKRDNYCCKMPGCKKRVKLNVHHIKRWADAPLLRYDVNNGITLCRGCHSMITGKESNYEELFMSIIQRSAGYADNFIRIMRIIRNAQRRN